MPPPEVDHDRFFDTYAAFVDSSETGPWIERLNARYVGLLHRNRHLLDGARVLDLATHDGRFAFGALQLGAARVVGIDVKAHLLAAAADHFTRYGVAEDRYRFLLGDMYDCIGVGGPFDVVLCFGILYHVNEHLLLLQRIAELEPRAVILDTHVVAADGAIVEVRSPLAPGTPPPGSQVEGRPSRAAIDAWASSLGWQVDYVDWPASGLTDRPHMRDYAEGTRVSGVIHCPEHGVPTAERDDAVAEVLARPVERDQQFIAVKMVADRRGLPPQALRRWVQRAEREAWMSAGFAAGPSDRSGS